MKINISLDDDLVKMAADVMKRESKLFDDLIQEINYREFMNTTDDIIAYVIRRGISDMEHTISLWEEHYDEVK